ncbi:uncharacterized protein LOC113005207 [Solenopsis invicta]|uniref:uncharacterized protein LOC113005207 n=1 Tax=Solenopsis invicta TaxID=13686 RepID=UPI00193DF6A6|nr:uncharacterized protein LOC113005207 [Solenopsis invicta]
MHTTAYHPSSNGMIERWHRTLKTAITCHNNPEWVDILPTVLLGLRSSIKEDIKASSAELLYGTTLRIPDKIFELDVNGKATTISTKRLKPAYFEEPSSGQSPNSEPTSIQPTLRTYPGAKKKVHFAA